MSLILSSCRKKLPGNVPAVLSHAVDPDASMLRVDIDFGFWRFSCDLVVLGCLSFASVFEDLTDASPLKQELASAAIDLLSLILFAPKKNLLEPVKSYLDAELIDWRADLYGLAAQHAQRGARQCRKRFRDAVEKARQAVAVLDIAAI